MIKRLTTLLVILPIGIIVVALAVANRQPVTLSMPPYINDEPFLSGSLPLFAIIFASVLVGMVIGSCATWFKQGRFRKAAKVKRKEASLNAAEAQKHKDRAEALETQVGNSVMAIAARTGLPAPSSGKHSELA
ncbi:MAG: LapA family protein [Pseudomonadota bacterium]